MAMTIAETFSRGKTALCRLKERFLRGSREVPYPSFLWGGVIVLLSIIASFNFGVLQGREQGSKIIIETRPLTANTLGASPPGAASSSSFSTLSNLPRGGQIVASKKGTRYYLPWCGGAGRIKKANIIWFSSRQEAEKAGYKPATRCPGL